jgi:hypothetical protein
MKILVIVRLLVRCVAGQSSGPIAVFVVNDVVSIFESLSCVALCESYEVVMLKLA